MMRAMTAAAAGLLMTTMAFPAAAQGGPQQRSADAALGDDVRCAYIGMGLSTSPDPKVRSSGMVATFYFLGRVDAQRPNLDLGARIRSEMTGATRESVQAEAKRCNAVLTTRVQALNAMGARMKAAQPAQKAAPTPP